jgi:hypothetical protein
MGFDRNLVFIVLIGATEIADGRYCVPIKWGTRVGV